MSKGAFVGSIPTNKFPGVPPPTPPSRPTNVMHDIAAGIGTVASAPGKAIDLVNTGFATATNAISQALPCFPAATMMSLALGAPHAHVAHPPSGPPPIPPTPLPPLGPVMLGTCTSVLINSKPAARCGDIGMNPTCCGIPPFFEVFTGSSKVFIGGARAARQMDVTYHCKPVPPAGAAARGAIAAARTAMGVAMKGLYMAGLAAQTAGMVGDGIEAATTDDSAMQAAMAMSTAATATQMASDAAAMAAGMAMGKDPCVPPGTPGMITLGSPTVEIGGFPMPSWMNVAKGLLKVVKALRCKIKRRRSKQQTGGKPGGG